MRKRPMLASCALACFTLSALPLMAQPYSDGEPWSGFYIGAHAGGTIGSSSLSFADLSQNQDLLFHNNNGSAFLSGVHGGYNWQIPDVLIGAEGDVSFAGGIDYLSSIRARLGVPIGPFLIYGTSGVAFETASQHFTVQSTSGGLSKFSRNVDSVGWTAGGGIETFVAPEVSLGLEGLYYDVGGDMHALATPTAAGAEAFSVRDERNFGVVRARLTYHFGW